MQEVREIPMTWKDDFNKDRRPRGTLAHLTPSDGTNEIGAELPKPARLQLELSGKGKTC